MLMLTPTAIEAVRAITSAEGSPENAGLRIYTAIGAAPLQLSVAAAPAEHDQVVAAGESRVFLDRRAAALLDDQILDTEPTPDGQENFVVVPQGPADVDG